MQRAVVSEALPLAASPADRFRNLVLVRIACALRGTTKAEIVADLAPIAGRSPAQGKAEVEREIVRLTGAGLVTGTARRQATETGKAQAARFLGIKGEIPHVWSELRDARLVAIALGLGSAPANRLKSLGTLDGLRSSIVESAFNLKIKGVPTPARLREALAATALKRAFGDKSTAGLAGKLGLSAKAGRLLAAQLASNPRDFGTDTRLVAALAAEQVGSDAVDLAGVRGAVLSKFFGGAPSQRPSVKRSPKKRVLGKIAPARVEALPSVPAKPEPAPVAEVPAPVPAATAPAQGRPDLPGFATEVRRYAAGHAQGWSGDRKAYISHVWRNIRDKRPEWGLSEIEFKCMLTEAHRAGQLALANADLKDKENIRDVQDSAVSFRNTVFHFIRVDT